MPVTHNPVLFIDIDGTVADSVKWWTVLYNANHYTTHSIEEITDYGLPFDLSPFFDDYRGVEPVEGAVEAVTRLGCYYKIVYVTVGKGSLWLQNRFAVSPDDVVRIKDRSLLRGYALIDDYEKNLLSFQGKRFMVKQPWNNGQSWKEIAEELLNEAYSDFADGVLFSPV